MQRKCKTVRKDRTEKKRYVFLWLFLTIIQKKEKSFVYQKKEKNITAIGCRDKDCKFACFNPEICGKRLTEKQLYDLVEKGVTGLVKGFVNKRSGKAFDRKVRFKGDFEGVEFV